MDRFTSCSPEDRKSFITELQGIGCCDLCVIRYLGVSSPHAYRDANMIQKLISGDNNDVVPMEGNEQVYELNVIPLKIQKQNSCVACLGLLQNGIESDWLDKIASDIKVSDIETQSYCPALSIPMSVQIRAYSIWYHLEKNFKDLLKPIDDLKPEGMSLKSVWKWICTGILRIKVNPDLEWSNSGCVCVQINPIYEEERNECDQLHSYLVKLRKGKRKHGCSDFVTRGSVEATFKNMHYEEFLTKFTSPPPIPSTSLKMGSVVCFHLPIFVAGRYCKYSRKLSQTPWILDNVRKTESSVEELISCQLHPFLKAEDSRFSSSGREDVDVRNLGKGRPFVFEMINPKRSLFSREELNQLQDKINLSTSEISVRDIQIVDRKDLGKLKYGEESKTKTYSALCVTPGTIVTADQIAILNSQKLPIVLGQKTPVRVLHRRSLACRNRSILEMEATLLENQKEMFMLRLKTEAGTYVKEFVHGDFGRTTPCVAELLGVEADILALDVVEVDLDWPPEIEPEPDRR